MEAHLTKSSLDSKDSDKQRSELSIAKRKFDTSPSSRLAPNNIIVTSDSKGEQEPSQDNGQEPTRYPDKEYTKREGLNDSFESFVMLLKRSGGPRTTFRKLMAISALFLISIFIYLTLSAISIPSFAKNINSNVRQTLSETAKSAHNLAKDPSALPVFSLILIVSGGVIGGNIAENFGQAPMLGMLLTGVALRNVFPFWIVPIPHTWTSRLWTLALASVVARAGLSLNASKLRYHFGVTMAIGCIPVLVEAIFLGLLSSHILHIPLSWTMTMAFGVASVSPGVVVPLVLNLREKPQWKNSRVLPMMLSSIGIDVLVATSGFGVSLATCFSGMVDGQEHDQHSWLIRSIEEIGLGVVGGSFLGSIAILLQRSNIAEYLATGSLFLLSSLAMIWAKSHGFAGAASCSTILTWAVVANVWKKEAIDDADAKLKFAWSIFKPFLFPVIGASISFSEIDSRIFFLCLMMVILSVFVKLTATYVSAVSMSLTRQEAYFWGGVWTGKASVQATLCHVALEQVLSRGFGGRPEEQYAHVVFTGMLCAILVGIPFASMWVKQFEGKSLHMTSGLLDSGTGKNSDLFSNITDGMKSLLPGKGMSTIGSVPVPAMLRNVKSDGGPSL